MALMVHVARSIVEGFRELGLPAEAIARRCGVSLEGDPSPFATLPDSVFSSLWRQAQGHAGSRNTLALEVGLALPFGAAGPLDYLVGSSATVDASLRVLQRSFALAASDVRLELEPGPGEALAVVIVNTAPFAGSWWSDELICGLLLSPTRSPAVAAGARPRLDLARPRPRNAERWAALVGCPVRFGQRHSAVHLPRSVLELPLRTADRRLAAALRSLVGMPAEPRSALVPALRAHLRSGLEGRGQSAKAAARSLGVSLRTLQRHLTATGSSFRGVLEEVRWEQAELLLSDSTLRVSEVAHRLGFAEQASFTRAFRRWTGVAPQRWRADRAGGATTR